ncbi:MAG TPA: 2-hydroxymuconate tautomerase family protein [Thermoanaerobaculia bacterium]|nr:2-hydroxymuconate tautomerase family protein [Thermoanaerobaculia bacterium]HUM30932.1 2-hydroxymuconate tautomerase family protein [Thermoanaerobaculia bacterium]HXK69265.1 2-hydroxymuconate tautomerase family protein [Thermoanaerobaculia bacterium]
MPIVTIEGPPIEESRKRNLVCEITEVMAKIYEFPAAEIIILIKENRAENVGLGGKLVKDLHEGEE